MNDEPIRRSEPLHLDVAEPSLLVRVVLAEIHSPGPLHYLIEGEGFQVVGCASNDVDLARLLAYVQPDVIVLDADISATSALVAREKAPSSELIVLWPDGVQLPSGAERIHPRLMYQELGPAIRRAAEDRRTRHPAIVEPEDDDVDARPEPPEGLDGTSSATQRTSTRILAGTAALIALIVLTIGASFALEGRSPSPRPTAPAITRTPSAIAGTSSAMSPPNRTRDAHPSVDGCVPGVKTDRKTPNEHASSTALGAPPACRAGTRGGAHRQAHRHGNHRASRPPTGSGNANANGSGNAYANGSGTAKRRSGAQGRSQGHPSEAPAEAPAGPPATPGGARSGPPG
ncbi:MAG: response regulator transcription factor [Actinobacteria bacterium]|nr:MAG: response regulator transcription factor [Actinomycetota bacterium]